VVSVSAVFGTSTIASATSIVINGDPTTFYDLRFFVSSSVTLVPGVTGFIQGALENTGTLPLTFKPWDSSLSTGGYGWNFNDPGFAIGNFGVGANPFPFITEGHVDSVQQVRAPPPDFSNVAGHTIAPGETYQFDLWSVLTGSTTYVLSASQFAFWDPTFAGWNSDNYLVSLLTGNSYAAGPLQEVALSNFTFGPTLPPAPVPEPSTLLLLGGGFAAAVTRKVRQLSWLIKKS
jgi:hypothetical protein